MELGTFKKDKCQLRIQQSGKVRENEDIILWVVPLLSNSHEENYYIFSKGFPNLNLHGCHCYWEGGNTQTILTVDAWETSTEINLLDAIGNPVSKS